MRHKSTLLAMMWTAAGAYMFYVFVDLTFLTPDDGADGRTLADMAFSSVFLLLGVYLLIAAWAK